MNHESWLERADRLRGELARLDGAQLDDGAVTRVVIARWLRAEFSTEPAEDTATLALFPGLKG